MDVGTFRKLFVMRDDAYAVQDTNARSYKTVKGKLTDKIIEEHLDGTQTIGLYQVKSGMAKWACIDIDIKKEVWSKPDFVADDWEDVVMLQAVQWKEALSKANIPSYLENSGNKGAHVWIFFDSEVPAESLQNTLVEISKKVYKADDGLEWEIYPKQPRADFGNLLKGPNGKHQASQKFSYFIDKVSGTSVRFATADSIMSFANPYDAILKNCEALDKMVTRGLNNRHLFHDERLQLAFIYGNLDASGKEYIKNRVFKHLSDYDEYITDKNLDRIAGKYKPVSCEGLQKKGICKRQCTAIGTYKSPIGFYYRELEGSKEETRPEKVAVDSYNPMDRFFSANNAYYEQQLGKDGEPKTTIKISNFAIRFTEDVTRFSEVEEKRIFKGNIHLENKEDGSPGEIFPFDIEADKWADATQVKKRVHQCAGIGYVQTEQMHKVMRCAEKEPPPKQHRYSKIIGYHSGEDGKRYFMPSVVVDKNGITANTEMPIDFSDESADELKRLDFKLLTEERFNELTEHIKNDLLALTDKNICLMSIACALMPIIYPFLPVNNRFYYLLQGTSGVGKTYILQALQRLFYRFDEGGQDATFLSWVSTPYSLQRASFFYKDAMCLIDDFKRSNVGRDYEKAITILQSYADNSGRARLRSDATSNFTYFARGWLTISGEDKIENHASTIARGIMVSYPTGKKQNFVAGKAVKENWADYPGITPYIIHKVLKTVDSDKKYYGTLYEDLREKYANLHAGEDNADRLAQNFAMAATCAKLVVIPWLYKEEPNKIDSVFEDFEKWLLTILKKNIQLVAEESSSQLFWITFLDMLASGKIRIQESNKELPGESDSKGVVVGFKMNDGKTVALIWGAVFNEVTKHLRAAGQNFAHSKPTVLEELHSRGYTLDKKAIPRNMNKTAVRVIRVLANKIENES